MKSITCISDTHGSHWDLDWEELYGSIIIHAGDWSNLGRVQELADFNHWISTNPFGGDFVCIAGNHDKAAAQQGYQLTKQMFSNATYLDNDLAVVQGLKIYGTPWSRTFGRWSFMKREEELVSEWDKIPAGIDILVVHTPPYGILDVVPRKGHVGSTSLEHQIFNRIKPRLVVCGHIHEGYGKIEKDGIIFVNASHLNEDYNPNNKPIQVVL